jgi:hypothetical protein
MLICGGTMFVSTGAEFTILLFIDVQVWNFLDRCFWCSMFALTVRFGYSTPLLKITGVV